MRICSSENFVDQDSVDIKISAVYLTTSLKILKSLEGIIIRGKKKLDCQFFIFHNCTKIVIQFKGNEKIT